MSDTDSTEVTSPARGAAGRRVTIDPVTRLEGHGRIEIFLDDAGEVERAVYQVTELRGFEAFCAGRPAEDMPQFTSRICGVCPTAHHMAAAKALDDLYTVEPPPTATMVRELVYHAFMQEDHALHVYLLGGPDLFVGPDAPKEARNLPGVLEALGADAVGRMISVRRRLRELIADIAGRTVHPVLGLPGGVAKGVDREKLQQYIEVAQDGLGFAAATLRLFQEKVLSDATFRGALTSETYTHRTHYMGTVGPQGRLSLYDGTIRVVDPNGRELAMFPAGGYQAWIAEHVEPWTYAKLCYLRPRGWTGLADGEHSSVYAVGPLARLNASSGFSTPLAQQAREALLADIGPAPVHHTLANHWARIIEMLYAAERMCELLGDRQITTDELRVMPSVTPTVGVGAVEAPRGTLIHHYETDEEGLVREANLIVATQHNAARIAMSVEKAAKGLIHRGEVRDGLLNRIEMAFRAYDPCNACATHCLTGEAPLMIRVRARGGAVVQELTT